MRFAVTTARAERVQSDVEPGQEYRDLLQQQEEVWLKRYNQFLSDYNKWLPAFLKEHGYELNDGQK